MFPVMCAVLRLACAPRSRRPRCKTGTMSASDGGSTQCSNWQWASASSAAPVRVDGSERARSRTGTSDEEEEKEQAKPTEKEQPRLTDKEQARNTARSTARTAHLLKKEQMKQMKRRMRMNRKSGAIFEAQQEAHE